MNAAERTFRLRPINCRILKLTYTDLKLVQSTTRSSPRPLLGRRNVSLNFTVKVSPTFKAFKSQACPPVGRITLGKAVAFQHNNVINRRSPSRAQGIQDLRHLYRQPTAPLLSTKRVSGEELLIRLDADFPNGLMVGVGCARFQPHQPPQSGRHFPSGES
ncbi:hypothetical protein AVEN_195002-1 [Araneus ventricosus]|uniref:Uncharacterized protein n=1 Tax=Araneus ventricosus TaxID=182803 RepID=A0A4Y2HP38_ARAVE|nr:hypothetical protein AVEN_195002-1 [Araneus ventricosus]